MLQKADAHWHSKNSCENSQKACIGKRNLDKTTGSRPKVYYFAIKKMFVILLLSFLSHNGTVFTS